MPRHKRVKDGDVARAALKKARSDSLLPIQRLFEVNGENVEEGSDGKDKIPRYFGDYITIFVCRNVSR
jgi:hypothetical protein